VRLRAEIVVAERRKKKRNSEWGWRLSGVVLCAFFALGVYAGLSVANRARAVDSTHRLSSLLAKFHLRPAPDLPQRPADGAVAVVERGDGFYTLSAAGELRGPLSAQSISDLPIISGPGLDAMSGVEMLDCAELVVRSEAALSELVSEIRVGTDGTATVYLERSHTVLVFDRDRAADELAHAAAVMNRWRDHLDLMTGLDMTTAGQAVVRLREPVNVALAEIGIARRDGAPGKEPAPR
jgi:Cell division protein FtsQ